MLDSQKWLLIIIDSCKHQFQLDCCHTLIGLFRVKYQFEDGFGPLYDELMSAIAAKDALLTI